MFNQLDKIKNATFGQSRHRFDSFLLLSIVASLLSSPAVGQETDTADEALEEVVVSATRRALQNALDIKFESNVIVDALSAGDIGDIPSLSVAEAIQGITGAATHPFKGAGSQVSIRGLGPFLGFSTYNGRAVTSGSADRDVNYQQFPAELINNIKIYKTQQADMVEGGISGIVDLGPLMPLEYGERALTAELRAKYNSHAARVEGNDGMGYRGSFSYVDQFETGLGDMGISIGYAHFDSGNPEEQYVTSSTFLMCDALNLPTGTNECPEYTQEMQANGVPGEPVLIPKSITYRTHDEEEVRDAMIATYQWEISDNWMLNADLQISKRYYVEDRHDFYLDGTARGISNIVSLPTYATLSYEGQSRIRTVGELYRRDEDYEAGGLNVIWSPTDDFSLSVDASSSNTNRVRVRRYARFRTDYVDYSYDITKGVVPEVTFDEGPTFNTLDIGTFDYIIDGADIRDRATNRESDIGALRVDADWGLGGAISNLKAGVRYSEFHRLTDGEDTEDTSYEKAAVDIWGGTVTAFELWDQVTSSDCMHTNFPNNDFFGSSGGGAHMGGSWATFDTECVIKYVTQGSTRAPVKQDRRGTSDINVKEAVTAAYIMADYEADWGVPVRGNFGIRLVESEITSYGWRTSYATVLDPEGSGFYIVKSVPDIINALDPGEELPAGIDPDPWDQVKFVETTTEVLPSFNSTWELDIDLLFRASLYKAMARVNIEDMSAARTVTELQGEGDQVANEYATPEEAITGVFLSDKTEVVGGNPAIEPMTSWNIDFGLEWYPNDDTSLAVAIYHKKFEAEIFPSFENEVIDINGVATPVRTEKDIVLDKESDLTGLEFTAQHAFTYLPKPFDGLGFKFSYNYADTNFETQDPKFGDELDKDTGTINPGLANLVPASIFGLSEHVASLTLYWDITDKWEIKTITKYRDEYFQPNDGDPKPHRWIEESTRVDLSASYKINDVWKLRVTGQNVLDEPRVGHRGAREYATTGWHSTGPKWEFSVRASFF